MLCTVVDKKADPGDKTYLISFKIVYEVLANEKCCTVIKPPF